MYDFPTEFDLNRFVGTSLDAITFGTYKIDLHSSKNYLIGIESDKSIDFAEPVSMPTVLTLLYPLINQAVSAVNRTSNNQLSFTFEQGVVLHIHGSNAVYECYSIAHQGQTLVSV